MIRLLDLPGVRELEALEKPVRGGRWLTEAELQIERDKVSIALFGVNKQDTERAPKSHFDFLPEGRISEEARAAAETQLDAYIQEAEDWEDRFATLEYEGADLIEAWAQLGIDITDDNGEELRCFEHLERQMYAAKADLLPDAKFTPDGSGRRASQDAEAWGAAFERAAKEFKPRRK